MQNFNSPNPLVEDIRNTPLVGKYFELISKDIVDVIDDRRIAMLDIFIKDFLKITKYELKIIDKKRKKSIIIYPIHNGKRLCIKLKDVSVFEKFKEFAGLPSFWIRLADSTECKNG